MIYKEDPAQESQNFWISYADLMAGLLFVFILLIGAIVIKYVFIQSDLQVIRSDLEKEKAALNMSEDELARKKSRLQVLDEKLKQAKEENIHLAFELSKAEEAYAASQRSLKLSQEQSEAARRRYASERDARLEQIRLNGDEIEKLKQLLFDYELNEKELEQKNVQLTTQLLRADERHDQDLNIIRLKDEELAMLENTLLTKTKAYQRIVEDLNITKAKIRELTGMKIKVVAALKDAMGDSIKIDPRSGAMRFSSNILFDQGGYELKEGAKEELKTLLYKYIHTLLVDKKIRANIDQITIEGHTNSDGSYLYNLQLSQKRALAVMEFLYSLDFSDEALFRRYLSASGRAYADPVMHDGEEDKDASRRIEIKFRLKNEKAIKELERFLER